MAGKTDAEAAAIEAIEEAGVVGRFDDLPIGKFRYLKRLSAVSSRHTLVSVFSMQVLVQLGTWPEDGERERRWMSRDDAARAVHEPDLAALIMAFQAVSPE